MPKDKKESYMISDDELDNVSGGVSNFSNATNASLVDFEGINDLADLEALKDSLIASGKDEDYVNNLIETKLQNTKDLINDNADLANVADSIINQLNKNK